MPSRASIAVLAVSAAVFATGARAQDNWTNAGSGKWETAGNWSAGTPSSSQQVSINNANTKTVTIDATTSGSFPGSLTVNSLALAGNGGGVNTLSLNNSGTATPLHVTGQLTMSAGGALALSNAALQVDSDGFLDGPASLLTGKISAADVIVGSVTGAQGTLTVSGGAMQLTSFLSAGDAVAGTGAVWVTGGQLVVTNHTTWIGYQGIGQMTFSNGAVLGQLMVLGQFPGAQGTLTLAGATDTLSSYLSIAESPSTTGAVWMTGGQLNVPNAQIEVGASGSGQLTLSNGVVQAGRMFVASSVGSAGTLTIAGGSVNLSSNMVIGSTSSNFITGGVTGTVFAAGTVWITGGQLTVTNAPVEICLNGLGAAVLSNGLVFAGDVHIDSSSLGSLTASASQGTLTVAGGTFTAYSSLIVGNCAAGGGAGTLHMIAGNLFITNSTATATLDVRNGTWIMEGGALKVDRLVMTNSCGLIVNNGGTITAGALVLDPNLSATGDGLPNGWKEQYGLDPLSSSGNNGPNGDPDGDGMSNLQEYLAGTDPMDSASALRITSVVRQGADVLITWQAVAGKGYVVQFVPINSTGYTNVFTDYSPLITMPDVGAPATTNYLDSGAATNTAARYYRVRLGP